MVAVGVAECAAQCTTRHSKRIVVVPWHSFRHVVIRPWKWLHSPVWATRCSLAHPSPQESVSSGYRIPRLRHFLPYSYDYVTWYNLYNMVCFRYVIFNTLYIGNKIIIIIIICEKELRVQHKLVLTMGVNLEHLSQTYRKTDKTTKTSVRRAAVRGPRTPKLREAGMLFIWLRSYVTNSQQQVNLILFIPQFRNK